MSNAPLDDALRAQRQGWRAPHTPPPLANGRVHEALGPAAAAFAALQAGLRRGPVIWILPPERLATEAGLLWRGARPDGYGLAPFLDPARLVLVAARQADEVYWAMEESLRAGAAPVVIAEAPAKGALGAPDLTRSRRLQLAAEAGGATGLLLLAAEKATRSNAAETRWRITPAPSQAARQRGDGVWSAVQGGAGKRNGAPRETIAPAPEGVAPPPDAASWRWRLVKNKRGPLGAWRVRWRDHGLHAQPAPEEDEPAARAPETPRTRSGSDGGAAAPFSRDAGAGSVWERACAAAPV